MKIAQQKKDASDLIRESLANGIKLTTCEKDDKECGNYWVSYYLKDHIGKEQKNNEYLTENLQGEENNLKHLQELKENYRKLGLVWQFVVVVRVVYFKLWKE